VIVVEALVQEQVRSLRRSFCRSNSAAALASDITILNKNVSKWEIDLGTWLGEPILGPVLWNFAECGSSCSNEETVFVVIIASWFADDSFLLGNHSMLSYFWPGR
jgi:hypothetical protein